MEVTITNACGRCGKTEARAVTVDEVITAREEQKQREAAIDELQTLINDSMSTDNGPEVVVCVKMHTGLYDVKMLDNLCDAPSEGKKKKGCVQRVASLIDDMFLENKPSPKTEPSDDGDSDDEEE